MNSGDINLIRKKYNSLLLEKSRLEKVKNKILELEQDPKVIEYLELVKHIKNSSGIKHEKQFCDDVDEIVSSTNASNKLLFDYGNISVYTLESEDEFDNYHGFSVSAHVYRDLETTDYYVEMQENKIELMPSEWRIGHCDFEHLNRAKYNELRKYFIEQILTRSQEEVVEELLKKNKQLVKGK